MVGEDVSQEHAWQFSQEVRLASNFSGPFNFSVGGNYMHYQTVEDYYVFFNLHHRRPNRLINGDGPGDYTLCHSAMRANITPLPDFITAVDSVHRRGQAIIRQFRLAAVDHTAGLSAPISIPIRSASLDGQGHNYFRSENPYRLNSYAGFGEAYYQVTPDVKLTGGLRWTDDSKTFHRTFQAGSSCWAAVIRSQASSIRNGRNGRAASSPTGRPSSISPIRRCSTRPIRAATRAAAPIRRGRQPISSSAQSSVTHPLTFTPEFVNAFELGTKNTLLDGAMTLNGDVFYYDYKGYQISQIVDRTSINLNFNAKVKGAELEATWEPMPGLRFNFAGGYGRYVASTRANRPSI